MISLSLSYLALRVRLRGSPRTRNSYFVNIQTDGYVTNDLWQHRLYFQRDDGEWEDVYVRFLSSPPPGHNAEKIFPGFHYLPSF